LNAWKLIEHNRYTVIGILVALLSAAVFVGCDITTESLTTPGEKVDQVELDREIVTVEADLAKRQAALNADIEAHNAAVATAQDDLQQKAEFRATIIETVGSVGLAAAEGTASPAAGVGAFVQLLTLGAAGGLLADNRRKDRVINTGRTKTESGPV